MDRPPGRNPGLDKQGPAIPHCRIEPPHCSHLLLERRPARTRSPEAQTRRHQDAGEPSQTHLAARIGPHTDHRRIQTARNHDFTGPDTGPAALKEALSCCSGVIAREFRAEGPENSTQRTANDPDMLRVSFRPQPEPIPRVFSIHTKPTR